MPSYPIVTIGNFEPSTLNVERAGPECCGRKSHWVNTRALVATRRPGSDPVAVVVTEMCHTGRHGVVRMFPTKGTHWMGKIRAAIKSGEISFEKGTLEAVGTVNYERRARRSRPDGSQSEMTASNTCTHSEATRTILAEKHGVTLWRGAKLPRGYGGHTKGRPTVQLFRDLLNRKHGYRVVNVGDFCPACSARRTLYFLAPADPPRIIVAHACTCGESRVELVSVRPTPVAPLRLKA